MSTQKKQTEKFIAQRLHMTNAGLNTLVNPKYNKMQHTQPKRISHREKERMALSKREDAIRKAEMF